MSKRQREAEFHKEDGNRLYHNNFFDQAVRCYTQAIQCDPSNPMYYANRAMALLQCRCPEEALRDSETVIRMQPQWHKGYLRRGQALLQLGHFQEALKALRIALSTTEDASERQEMERMIAKCQSRLTVAVNRVPQEVEAEGSNPPRTLADLPQDLQKELEAVALHRQSLVKLTELSHSAAKIEAQDGETPKGVTPVDEAVLSGAHKTLLDAQMALKAAASGDNREAFHNALVSRDGAVDRLSHLAQQYAISLQRSGAFERFAEGDPHASVLLANGEQGKALAGAVNKALASVPAEYRQAVARSNGAIRKAIQCLRAEQEMAEQSGIKALTSQVLDAYKELADKTLNSASLEDQAKARRAKLDEIQTHTNALQPYLEYLESFKNSKNAAMSLLAEKDELEARRLALEKRRITLRADIEWKQVVGTPPEKLSEDIKNLEHIVEQIKAVTERKGEVAAAFDQLTETSRPELLCKGVSQGPIAPNPLTAVNGNGSAPQQSPPTRDEQAALLRQLFAALNSHNGLPICLELH